MDSKKIIREVKKRRPLWDLKLKKTVDKNLIIQLWEEVAVELDFPTNDIKKRWKNLRDTYRIALKRRWYSWKYFETLSFLRDVMYIDESFEITNTPTKSHENVQSSKTKRNNDYKNDVDSDECSSLEYNMHNDPLSAKKRKGEFSSKENERNRGKIKPIDKKSPVKKTPEDNMDGDYQFLLSFLPIMNEMTNIQKLEFRAQMSNVTLNIMRPASNVNDDIDFDEANSSFFNDQTKQETMYK